MEYVSVKEMAARWGISPRSVRNYCAAGRVAGAFLTGKTWNIPADASKPVRRKRSPTVPPTLLQILRREKESQLPGGIYHKLQIDMTYNSNHIEGSRLTHEQTRYIFETKTVGITDQAVRVDDIVETVNHFHCIDRVIEHADRGLSESFIKELHRILKTGTTDAAKDWFAVGEYKKLPNEVGGTATTAPEAVADDVEALLRQYGKLEPKTLDEILDFHVRFERIHPFQDGNGRIGRLLMLSECLRNDMTPIIITDELKMFYYRGLHEWDHEKGYLRDTCLTAQDYFQKVMAYFRIGGKGNYDGIQSQCREPEFHPDGGPEQPGRNRLYRQSTHDDHRELQPGHRDPAHRGSH